MNTPRWLAIVAIALALPCVAHGQKAPRIGYVYPAGGRQGTTFEVMLGGQNLVGAYQVYFSGKGLEAKVLSIQRPLSAKDTELLRDRLSRLEEQRKSASREAKAEAESDREMTEIKEKLADFASGRPLNNAIAENVTLQVTLAPDATLGEQEIRVATPAGLSNPLVFCVGQLPEYSAPPAKGSMKAEIDGRPRKQRTSSEKQEFPVVTLPAVLNGQILPGEVDRIRFIAHRGQRVLVAVNARRLIPYLADAVPGWFQADVAIRDATGHELAFADDFRFDPDPVFCYYFAQEGEYVIEIRDSIYRGREDFVYRITLGELPFITGLYPLGGTVDSQCNVQLRGWNLSTGTISLDLHHAHPGPLQVVSPRGQTVSNFVPFAVDTLPEMLEKEPNNTPATAQPITLPVMINGRIDQPGEADFFRIEGHAGDEIVAEIYARRLNSPLDSVLTLTDAAGKQIAYDDDHEDKGAGLTTHHADSLLTAKLPADGAYFLRVADAQHAGGPDYSYRLRVSAPQPDFALRVVPSSISGRAGAKVPITIYALRRDGFAGAIAIALKDAPSGIILNGGSVPGENEQAKLSVTLPETLEEPVALALEGRATIDGREVVRPVVPAEEMQQAFAYRHLVPSKQLMAWAVGRFAAPGTVKIVTDMPVKIPVGGTARVKIAASIGNDTRGLQIEPTETLFGVSMNTLSITPEGAEIEISADADRVVAGENGNLSVQALVTRDGPGGKKRRVSLGAFPAIAFEVVAP